MRALSTAERDAVVQPYEAIHYPNFAHRHTDPDRLATIARLHGIDAPPVTRCRVLEIGCARGGNVAAMAMAMPHARFVGVDLSESQIADGRAALEAANIRNVELLALDLSEIGSRLGTFDYIIAHGIYSWVSADAQEEILAIFARCLAKTGVAFVSYNTRPGWREHTAIRDALIFDTRDVKDPKERIQRARNYLAWLAEGIPDGGEHGTRFLEEVESMRALDDQRLLHEYLGPFHMPLHFRRVVARAARHGFWYLCDAEPAHTADHSAEPIGERARERAPDELVFAEQYYDFLCNRRFRRSLLCRRGSPLTRTIDSKLVEAMFVSSRCVVDGGIADEDIRNTRPITFRTPQSDLTTGHPVLKAALAHLAAVAPRAIPFAELLDVVGSRLQRSVVDALDAEDLRKGLLNAFLSTVGTVTLRTHAPPCVSAPGERPTATAWARQVAKESNLLPSIDLEMVRVDGVVQRVVPLLDGTRDRAALDAEIAAMAARGEIAAKTPDGRPAKFAPGALDGMLRSLARNALLIA